MQRRTVIKLLGVGAVASSGGCMGPQAASSPDSGTGTDSDSLHRRITVAERDTVSEEHQVSINPTVTQGQITGESHGIVTLETTNTGESRYFSSMRTGLHFHPEYGGERSDSPRGLVLLENDGKYTPTDRKWQHTPYDDGGAGLPGTVIDAGETVLTEYLVLDDATVSGYLRPDTYRFEAPVIIKPDAEKGPPSGTVAEFTWGFSLIVTRE